MKAKKPPTQDLAEPKKDFTRRDFLKATSVALSSGLIAPQHAAAATEATGMLQVEIRDGATKEAVPAMVCITSLADHKWRIPPDGRTAPPYTTTRDFYEGLPSWKPGDIGPVRVTRGDYHSNDTRSSVYGGKSSYPFWREPATYFVSKPFSIILPVGKWRLAVARGIEFRPLFEEFDIAEGETLNRKVLLYRWVNMPKLGWYSGDDHVHMVRVTPNQNELLMTWTRAEDVHVSNILRMGDPHKTYFEQEGYGEHYRYQHGDHVLASGQEDPRMHIGGQGHAIGLNLKAPVRDVSRYRLYDVVFDGIHAQGGLAGYAHLAWARQLAQQASPREQVYAVWDATINVVRNKVDFLEILQFRMLGLKDYYDFLNLGFKLTASAGTDLPWGNTIGEVRMYAHTGPDFSADAWFAAMKAGRTFVTNGPMLTVTAEGAIPGNELKVQRNRRVRIRVRTWAPASIGSPKTLEVISQGRVIHSAESRNPDQHELKIDFHLKAEESQWIAARVKSHNGALAHTSPVYVLVNGESFRNQKDLPQLVKYRTEVLDYIGSRLRDPQFVSSEAYRESEVKAFSQELEDARTRYRRLLTSGPKDQTSG